MSRRALPLLLTSWALVCGTSFAADVATSKYTSTAREKSLRFEEDHENPADFRGRFRGFGDYDLEHVGGDERSWINVLHRGKRVDLYSATMDAGAATGAFPHKANGVVEWRGSETKGRFTPYAVIYRIVGLDEVGRRRKSRLLVIRLEGAKSRIVGHADEPNAEEKARRIADQQR